MSGIYIPDMEMPKNCCECFAFKSNANGYLFCKAKRIAFGKEDAEWLPLKTPNWCPLIPVPDHGRLIDALWVRDRIIKQWMDYSDDSHMYKRGMEDAYEVIRNAPTIIPADKEGE